MCSHVQYVKSQGASQHAATVVCEESMEKKRRKDRGEKGERKRRKGEREKEETREGEGCQQGRMTRGEREH